MFELTSITMSCNVSFKYSWPGPRLKIAKVVTYEIIKYNILTSNLRIKKWETSTFTTKTKEKIYFANFLK